MSDANTLPERQSSSALISPPTIVLSPSATALDEAGLQSQRLISDDDNVSVVTTEKSDDEGAFVTLDCLPPQTQTIRLLLSRHSDLKVIEIHNQFVGDVSCILNQQDMDELCSYGLRPNECIVCVCSTVFGFIFLDHSPDSSSSMSFFSLISQVVSTLRTALTTRLCQYFRGRHKVEDIMLAEGLTRSQVQTVVDEFSAVLTVTVF